MTTIEIDSKYRRDRLALHEKHVKDLEARLAEVHLDGKVRRKRDGKIGWLRVRELYIDGLSVEIAFFPVTKTGEMSKHASGGVDYAEELFEPVEAENE